MRVVGASEKVLSQIQYARLACSLGSVLSAVCPIVRSASAL